MKERIMNFLRDEEGLTTVEYAVAGALVTVAVVAAFTALGGAVGTTITSLTNAVNGTP
jgi:pilus assembly protein Flp/PilA